MRSSRDTILNTLRAAQQPFEDVLPVTDHLPMVLADDLSPATLRDCFVEKATALGCRVVRAATHDSARQAIQNILGGDHKVQAWDFRQIPLSGLMGLVQVVNPRDSTVRVGITGADAALAATGSLVLLSGAGKHRLTSLLPPVHIAVVSTSVIVPDFETWVSQQRSRGIKHLRGLASAMIVSGQSRTADISMQLTMGMHGPEELHIILIEPEIR